MLKFLVFSIVVLVLKNKPAFGAVSAFKDLNLTDFKHHRQKRALIFEGGGAIRLDIGPIWSLDTQDPIEWRSLVFVYNLQGGGYTIPTTPLYPWDKWENIYARQMKKIRNKFDRYGEWEKDESRLFVYTAMEDFMNRNGRNGRECLLRLICENAQVQQHVGIFSEVLNIVLTPGKERIDPAYKQAHIVGKNGVDCLKLYHLCPVGHNFMDKFLIHF